MLTPLGAGSGAPEGNDVTHLTACSANLCQEGHVRERSKVAADSELIR
jgi:hypothetical protein